MRVAAFAGGPGKRSDTLSGRGLIKRGLIDLLRGAASVFKSKDKLPSISVFGARSFHLVTPVVEDYEEKRLDCRFYPSDSDIEQVLIRDRPHVIITIGSRSSFPELSKAPFEIRKRWLHYDSLPELTQLGIGAYDRYLTNVFDAPGEESEPLVTVFTPAYRTGERIERPFRSLIEQTYSNWEWIIVDDSDDGGRTFRILTGLAGRDHRVQVFKSWEHSGIIGKVKNWACSLGRGQILVELDHDDELTDDALENVVEGFRQFPEAGFLYTDSAEIFEDGRSLTYRKGWAFGYGSYKEVEYRGRLYKSGNSPNINGKTIRHIISAPNHIRAWRKGLYDAIGGHNKELHVADDYEILVRTFLKTRMVRVPKLCYIQYVGNDTAQQTRNKDIHRHVRSIRGHYDRMIHTRFLELRCDDFIWDEKNGRSDLALPNPEVEPHVTLIADVKSKGNVRAVDAPVLVDPC
jgi:O-antigen biosynthesis protein